MLKRSAPSPKRLELSVLRSLHRLRSIAQRFRAFVHSSPILYHDHLCLRLRRIKSSAFVAQPLRLLEQMRRMFVQPLLYLPLLLSLPTQLIIAWR